MERPTDETLHLRRCVRELAALSVLSAAWGRTEPPGIAASLADVLLRSLPALDFVYVRVQGLSAGACHEAVRASQHLGPPSRLHDIGKALGPLLQGGVSDPSPVIPNPVGEGEVRLAVVPVGYEGDCGVLVAGSRQPDFPGPPDQLLLGVAANQAAVVLQHKRSESTLREQSALLHTEREWLRVTLASIGDAVVATDTAGRVTFLNSVAESLTGWTNDEAVGRPLEVVFEIVNEQTRTPVANPVSKVLRDGRVVGLANHTVLIAKDGTERPIDDSAAPIRGKGGEIVGCVLVFRDISEKKRAEAEVRASEERFRTLFESMEEAFCVVEMLYDADDRPADYRFLEANPAFEKHTGFKDAVGRTIRELVQDHDAHWFEIYGRVAATGEATRFVNEAKAMGRWYDVYAYRVGGPDSRKVGILFTDITERRRAERRLAEAHQFLHSSLDALTSHIAVLDENGVILAVNDAWRRFADENGYAGSDYGVGSNYFGACGPRPGAGGVAAVGLGGVLSGREPFFEAEYACHSPAEQRWFVMRATRFKSPGPVRVVVAHENVTKRREAEDALSEADRRKDEFLATLAHELRNPLAPIRNGLQVMRLAGGNVQNNEQARSMMERQVTHLVRLVDDLMDVSRISRGKIELRKERVQLAAVVNSAVETSLPLIKQMGHELTTTLTAEPVVLDADPTRLEQVFQNLLNNAAKYSDRGGHIWLAAERRGGDVVVSVKDNGIGIAADHLPRLFEMFSQLDRSLEKSQGGLGIGLTLVKRLVEMHGGGIEARSEGPGKGSEFVVRLPVVRALVPEQHEGRDHGWARTGGQRRILVADDNVDAASSLALLLRLMGHEVRTVHDGLAAVEAAEALRPDVILLDIGMPKLSGYDACRRIREQPWGRGVVLVALTGWGQEEDKRRSKEAGFDSHFVKPVDPAALTKLLAGLKSETA